MPERAPLEVEEFLTHLAIEKGRSANTLAAYRRDLATWAEHTSTPIGQRSADDVLAFNRALQARGLAPASVNRAMAAVRGLHRFLLAEGLMSTDPTADVEAGKLPRGLPKALSEDEVTRLLDAVTGEEPAHRRDRAILEVLYGTGMRISEMVSLSLEDLDLDGFKQVELKAAANGAGIARDGRADSHEASYAFAGDSGVFDIIIDYFDEADGDSELTIAINGQEVDSWTWDDEQDEDLANAASYTSYTVQDVVIEKGDTITLIGNDDGREPLRIDAITFEQDDFLIA